MTKVSLLLRIVLDYDKLSEALGFGVFGFPPGAFRRGWPLVRCALCGKLARPHPYSDRWDVFISQFDSDGRGLYIICRDHGGNDGQAYVDCETAQEVSVGPSPPFAVKCFSDWLREGLWLAHVALRYMWFSVRPAVWFIRSPIKYLRYQKRLKELKGEGYID